MSFIKILGCFALFFSGLAFAQSPVAYGIKGGFALTDPYGTPTGTTGITSDGKGYIVGPFVELRFLLGLGVEADALYHPVNLQNSLSFGVTSSGTYTSWEFPVLAKYRFPVPLPLLKPLIEAGPAFRAHGSGLPGLKAEGFTFGGGVELKVPLIRLSSELRYTRWASAASSPTVSPNANQAELLFGIVF